MPAPRSGRGTLRQELGHGKVPNSCGVSGARAVSGLAAESPASPHGFTPCPGGWRPFFETRLSHPTSVRWIRRSASPTRQSLTGDRVRLHPAGIVKWKPRRSHLTDTCAPFRHGQQPVEGSTRQRCPTAQTCIRSSASRSTMMRLETGIDLLGISAGPGDDQLSSNRADHWIDNRPNGRARRPSAR
jgi:hypothetical protein